MYALESRSGAPIEPSSPGQCQEEEDNALSMAPWSQEASFLTVEDEAVPTTSVSKKSVSSALNRAGTPEEGSSSESESEEFPASRDQLKARVYSLLREKAHVPFASPPRIQKTLSTFETSCGLSRELSSSYKSFPESKHVSTALQVIQDSLASPPGSFSNNTGKFPGFGPSSFPGRFRSKDFEIYNSSIGKSAPTCDKAMASLLGSKSVDRLRLTLYLWSKSDNHLWSTSPHALGTAERFLSAAGVYFRREGMTFRSLSPSYSKLTRLLVCCFYLPRFT